jgi:hypothetical protein
MHQLGAKVRIAEISLEFDLKACDDIAYSFGDEKVLEILENAKPYQYTQPKRESYEERGRRGAVLREAVRKAEASPEAETIARQALGAKTCKRLAALWAQAGRLKSEERDLLFTLHAFGEGEAEFSFYYRDLYRLLYPSDGSEIKDGKLKDAARKKSGEGSTISLLPKTNAAFNLSNSNRATAGKGNDARLWLSRAPATLSLQRKKKDGTENCK